MIFVASTTTAYKEPKSSFINVVWMTFSQLLQVGYDTRVMEWWDTDTSPRWLQVTADHPSCHQWSQLIIRCHESDQCLMRMKWQSCKGILFTSWTISKLVYIWFWSDNVIAFDVTRQSVPLKSLSIYSIYSMPVIIFKTVNPSPRPILTVSSKENQRHSCYKWMTYFYLQYGLKGNTQPFETDTYNTSHI